ncbi:MAG: ATP synthase subunit I [Gammaproteobacteria bacterium]|nr:ATP synthase subunit I [Gammaproteobacteria bacterium]
MSGAVAGRGTDAGWWSVVGKTIALQWAVILILAAAAWPLSGIAGAVSLVLGGAAVAFPNTLLALWLTIRVQRVGSLTTTALLFGELLKLGLTLALLALFVAKFRHTVVWLALIIGVVGALKAQWLALWVTRKG